MLSQIKKSFSVLIISVCLGSFAWSQGETATSTDDSIFNDGGDQTAQPTTAPDPMDASGKKPLSFIASFNASGAVIPGWDTWDKAAKGFDGLSVSGGVVLSSVLTFTARFNSAFSFQGGLTVVYPNTTLAILNPTGNIYNQPSNTPITASTGLFAVSINDIFADYSIANLVFVKIGRFANTWGNSYFFKSSDIINRAIAGVQEDGLRLKVSIPIGPVNVSVLGQAFNGYFADLNSISVANVGYALHLDVPIGPVEIGLGGFYQKQMTPRIMLSLKSSISPIDFFLDFTTAIDYNTVNPTNNVYVCLSAGLYGDIKEIESQFYLEYLYNGEKQYQGNQWVNMLPDSYQPGGHNVSFLWRWKRSNKSIFQPLAQVTFNFTDLSGLIIPGLIVYLTDNLKLQFGLPLYFDSNHNALMKGEAGVLSSDNLRSHTFGLVVALTLSGTATTD